MCGKRVVVCCLFYCLGFPTLIEAFPFLSHKFSNFRQNWSRLVVVLLEEKDDDDDDEFKEEIRTKR
jgi:hypothetical protein